MLTGSCQPIQPNRPTADDEKYRPPPPKLLKKFITMRIYRRKALLRYKAKLGQNVPLPQINLHIIDTSWLISR
jgi:hypothetical protein